jgi:hypothetical protein
MRQRHPIKLVGVTMLIHECLRLWLQTELLLHNICSLLYLVFSLKPSSIAVLLWRWSRIGIPLIGLFPICILPSIVSSHVVYPRDANVLVVLMWVYVPSCTIVNCRPRDYGPIYCFLYSDVLKWTNPLSCSLWTVPSTVFLI